LKETLTQKITVHIGVDIGCIECGEASDIVAINTDREKVQRALKQAKARQAAAWHGEHHFRISTMPLTVTIPVEY